MSSPGEVSRSCGNPLVVTEICHRAVHHHLYSILCHLHLEGEKRSSRGSFYYHVSEAKMQFKSIKYEENQNHIKSSMESEDLKRRDLSYAELYTLSFRKQVNDWVGDMDGRWVMVFTGWRNEISHWRPRADNWWTWRCSEEVLFATSICTRNCCRVDGWGVILNETSIDGNTYSQQKK